jgi:trk system potassium uptake protein TrkA
MGSGIAHNLVRSNQQVSIVDLDPQAFHRLGPDFPGRMITGDALDRESFVSGGAGRADGLAAVTGSDAINIVVARVARQVFRVPKVVARIHDPLNAEVYRRLGVQTVTSVELGIMRITELLTFSHLDLTCSFGTGGVSVVAVEIPQTYIGHSISELSVPGEIVVISLTRGGKTVVPALGTILQKGDLIHIAVEDKSVSRLKSLLKYT